MTYFSRLSARVAEVGSLCVGIDPHPGVLDAWAVGQDLAGVEKVALGTVDALADKVAAFKPQSAFFEQWGSGGIAVLEKCVNAARQAGALVILDVKRGDIGSTMDAYARAYLGDGPMGVDAITLSPYLGFDALRPALDLAEANGRGVYVLARTSNPEGADIQLGHTASGSGVAQSLVDQAARRNQLSGDNAVGLVIGGTHASLGVDLSGFQACVLVPGIGAQGGTMAGVETLFAGTAALILPSVSREILYAGSSAVSLREAVDKVLWARTIHRPSR
ncbi:MAG: orotidine-5'-phosphate decarboxylase [Propionibacteriaceae bacterium]|nr:orotidine-5'-phosphate decarboxylase [Propionibacteriaceae bacterium]